MPATTPFTATCALSARRSLHWRWINGLRVADGPRLAHDAAWLIRTSPGARDRLIDLLITADRRRILSIDELIPIVEEPVQFDLPLRVPAVLRQAVEELRPGFSHSRTEALARRIATEQAAALGLEVHPRPLAVRDPSGRIIAEADVAVPAIRHDLEVDGPHHDLRAQQARDAVRDTKVHGIDWGVDRCGVAMIDEDLHVFGSWYRDRLHHRLDALG